MMTKQLQAENPMASLLLTAKLQRRNSSLEDLVLSFYECSKVIL